MATIIGRTHHPVNIKKIPLLVWSLREELEMAIAQKLAKKSANSLSENQSDSHNESSSSSVNLDDFKDLKEFYGRPAFYGINSQNVADISSDNSMEGGLEALGDFDSQNGLEETQTEQNTITAASILMLNRMRPAQNRLSPSFALMTDIHMNDMLFFSKLGYNRGQSIVISFEIPKNFILTAEIVKCEDIGRNSRIIGEDKPNYRIQCRLTFNQPGERTQLREFLKSIEPDIPPEPVKKKKAEVENDDFDDLGF